MTSPYRPRAAFAALACAFVLVACGGGAGQGTQAPAATPATGAVSTPPAQSVPDTAGPDDAGQGVDGAALTLPIEVLGDGDPASPVIAEAVLHLPAGTRALASQLWFVCHRCGVYGSPEFERTSATPVTVKASVRVLGSAEDAASVPWIDITDASVRLQDNERLSGGIDGGFHTVRAALALDAATVARLGEGDAGNRVQFRFNGTDGESNGYRILDLQLRDAAGRPLDDSVRVHTDPRRERQNGAIWSQDVPAGKALWYANDRLRKSSIVARTLRSSCASCHASDGHDLQYFNYSDNAIVQRGRFHGLSEAEARQIAAFVRHAQRGQVYVDKARPWNPPYQPGPGLDCGTEPGCENAWAAGAGLEAVLDTPAQAARALFAGGDAARTVTQADIDALMDANATLNLRQMPVALQFPDWNAWLPTEGPEDIWPQGVNAEGAFVGGARFSADNGQLRDPLGHAQRLAAWFQAHRGARFGDWSHLTPQQRGEIAQMLYLSGWEVYGFLGGGRGAHIAGNGRRYGAEVGADTLRTREDANTIARGDAAAFSREAYIERATGNLLRWNAVQQWDMARTFGLEGNQRWFIGDLDTNGQWHGRGEDHGWPFNTPSLFYLAPHMTYQTAFKADGGVAREWILAWEPQDRMASYYRSNQWYQLQMTVNAGGQSGWVNYPMDWPYLTAFDEYIADLVGDATPAARALKNAHEVRLLQGRIKAAQYVANAITLDDRGETRGLPFNDGRYGRAQALKHLQVTQFTDRGVRLGTWKSRYHFLDEVQPGLYLGMVNGAIHQFNSLYAATDPQAWRRCVPGNTELGDDEVLSGFRFCLDAQALSLGTDGARRYMLEDPWYRATTEQHEQFGLWEAKRLGAEPARVATWERWMKQVWPEAGR